MQRRQLLDQHITMRLVGGNPRGGGGELGENVGQKTVVDMQVDRFPHVGIAGTFEDEADPDLVERGLEARRALERAAVELVGIFEGDLSLVQDMLHRPLPVDRG